MACDNAVEDYAWGAISIVGDHGSGLSGVPMFSYQANEEGTAWVYYFSYVKFLLYMIVTDVTQN